MTLLLTVPYEDGVPSIARQIEHRLTLTETESERRLRDYNASWELDQHVSDGILH